MKNSRVTLLSSTILLTFIPTFVQAETVTVPHIFSPGTPSIAAEVNENFFVLQNSINELIQQNNGNLQIPFRISADVKGPNIADSANGDEADPYLPEHHVAIFENTRSTTNENDSIRVNTGGVAVILHSDGQDDLTDDPDVNDYVLNTINRNDHFATFYRANRDGVNIIVGRIEGESVWDLGAYLQKAADLATEFPINEWVGIKFNDPEEWIKFTPPYLDLSNFSEPYISGGNLPSLTIRNFVPPRFTNGSLPSLSFGSFNQPTLTGGRPPSLRHDGFDAPSFNFSSGHLNGNCEGNEGSDPTQVCIDLGLFEIDFGFPDLSIDWGDLDVPFLGFQLDQGSLPNFNIGTLGSNSAINNWIKLYRGTLPTFNAGSLQNFPDLINFSKGALPTLHLGSLDPQNFINDFKLNPGGISFEKAPIEFFDINGGNNGNSLGERLVEQAGPMAGQVFRQLANPIEALVSQAMLVATGSGVSYESGAGDYAEWMERIDPEEQLSPGEVVGVFAGKISKKTEGADHLMVVSLKPIVLGNMPDEDVRDRYNKIAFMGQTPAFVRGYVQKGDFILPSGKGDGLGRAVNPELITITDLPLVIGVAWSESNNIAGISPINLAVGLRPAESAKVFVKQQQELHDVVAENRVMKQQMAELLAQNNLLQQEMAKTQELVSGLELMEKKLAQLAFIYDSQKNTNNLAFNNDE
ncbi:cell division protein ZapB [Aliiglaciecola litoralis]|uniref:Uncharacterized protein n=1 Tax=Aliiglaciecola litoralis TaxID=582857 RepID=A0ABP3WYQ9_9ALTE